MEALDFAYEILLWGALIFLALAIIACLIRAILGPRFTDRVVCVNVICTKSIIIIAILSFLLEQSHLLDIAIVYAMISFLAVVILSKCYLLPNHINPMEENEIFHREKKEDS